MSYCRWSSDDYQCDVYVWADVAGGYRTEVAGRRHSWLVPLPPVRTLPIGEAGSPERTAWANEWVTRSSAVSALMDDESNWEWLDLPTPEGGNSYWHDTPAEAADNLERLRAEGFNVPQSAIDGLRAEMHDEASA